MSEPIKVLFITGFGRSGTTIVDSILGQIEGFFSLGETQFIWDRSLRDNKLCGCGETFADCPVWQPIAEKVLADLGPEDLQDLIKTRDALTPTRVFLRSATGSQSRSPALDRYVERVSRLLTEVQRSTGARVLVDSSKSPSHGLVLSLIPNVELYVLHMVRNPRSVSYSWQKKKIYDPSGDKPMYMARLSLRQSATHWFSWNAAAEVTWRRSPRKAYRLVRYEDFTESPRETVADLAEMIGEKGAKLPFESPSEVRLGGTHSVAGNPNRFETGSVEIRRDVAWREKFSAAKQLAIVSLTWPLLPRYNYLSPLIGRPED